MAKATVVLAFLYFISTVFGTSIVLNSVGAQTGSFICCETYAPTQQLFYCVIGNAPNFETFDSSGVAQTFVPDATGFGVIEQRVAAVQPAIGTPFSYGGWTLGDIFIGNAGGVVIKISGASTITNPWVHIVEETESARQTVFDRTGTVYNGDLIVSFSYSVYRVFSNATYQLIVHDTSLTNYEGLDIVPTNTTRYGPLSGTILIPQNPDTTNPYAYCCSTPTNVAAIDASGTITYYNTGCYTDQIFVVHDYDNFYGLDYGSGKNYSSSWTDLQGKGLDGEIICMCEAWGYSWGSGLRRLYWDPVSQSVLNEPIYSDPAGAISNVGLWEHGCFSRGGSANILPGGFSFCFYVNQDNAYTKLSAVQLTDTITQNWGISGVPSSITFPASGLPTATAGAMTVSFVQDAQNSFYLQIVNSAASGSVDLSIDYTGPADSNMLVRIQNNPSDSYLWNGVSGRFVWNWSSGTTGVVIGPISAIIALAQFSFTFTINSATGVTDIDIVGNSNVVKSYPIASTPTFSLSRISCLCGDGVSGDDPILKECEYAGANTPCCTPDCHYTLNTNVCEFPTDNCTGPSYCTGQSATCPPLQLVQACNCTYPYYGYGCSQVRCDQLTDCNTCNQYSQCSYCCSGTSASCTVASSCSTPYPSGCPVCPPCANGTCECGVCVCEPGYGGTSCNEIVDCTNQPVPIGQTPKKIDICGICGGNGTSCIGCDGIPFGKTYDRCGVCGGDGSSCYNPCPGSTCAECTSSDVCGWCQADSKCYPTSDAASCTTKLLTADQSKLGISICDAQISTGAIVGAALGTAAIVGIAVAGAAVAVIGIIGGKKGYDAYIKGKNNMSGAQSNPMYNDSGRAGNNPFYNNNVEMRNKGV